jgi:hypothetical protein
MTSPYLHLSVDDVLGSALEAGARPERFFEQPLFSFLRQLHEGWGARLDLYLFLEGDVGGARRRLSEVPASVRAELEPLEWLRFGPHARDYQTPPYAQPIDDQIQVFEELYAEIDRLAGPSRRSPWVRLHSFSESLGIASYWRQQGVSTLLLTDRPVVSYHLAEDTRDRLAARGRVELDGLSLVRSHERLEFLARAGLSEAALRRRLDAHVERHGGLVVFSHEQDLGSEPVRQMARLVLDHAVASGLALAPE